MAETDRLGRIALYEDDEHAVHLDVRIDGETVWLTQQQMAVLFGRSVPTISRHVKTAREEELAGIAVVADFATTAADGKTYQVEHYNLDVIISVGYRVKSQQGVRFRRWANEVLKQYLAKGYAVNRRRLEALGTAFKILERAEAPELAGAAEVLQHYLPSLSLLDAYDTGRLGTPAGSEPAWRMSYEDAAAFVRSLPFYGESGLFGRERDGQFAGIVNALYQGFGGQDLYPTVQEKAANLLYLVVKDHPFLDGNKRSAAALFVWFLDKNGVLRDGPRLSVEGNALAAMTLMIALSDPSEKESMVALVENFIG